jgi:hypothetical protein
MKTRAPRSRWHGAIAHGQLLTLLGMVMIGGFASAAVEHLPTGEDVLDRHVEATGGKEAHLRLTTRKSTGTLAVDLGGHNFEAKLERHARAPSNSHLVIQGDQIYQVRANNAQHAWEWRPSNHLHGSEDSRSEEGITELLEGTEKDRTIEDSRFHADVEWRNHFTEAKTLGVADVQGRPAYEVEMTAKSGEKYSRFYDRENGRLVKSARETESSQMGEIEVESFFEDYREFDGVWLATRVRQVLSSSSFGTGTQIWTYDTIEHDLAVPASLFQVPEDLD